MAEDYLQEEDPFHPTIDWALWRKILVFARPYRWWLLALAVPNDTGELDTPSPSAETLSVAAPAPGTAS
mgnify:CR=1 FL=1